MPVRFAITKVSGQGEQLVVDICQWNPVTGAIVHKDISEMQKLLDESLRFCDLRLEEMNLRMLEAYDFESYFEPGVWQQVCSVLEIIAGRQTASQVISRWKSIKEENADLQRIREEHAAVVS